MKKFGYLKLFLYLCLQSMGIRLVELVNSTTTSPNKANRISNKVKLISSYKAINNSEVVV